MTDRGDVLRMSQSNPYVAVGDTVVLRAVLPFMEIYHLAKVTGVQRRFGWNDRVRKDRIEPLLRVQYLDVDSIEKEREFTAMMRKDMPNWIPAGEFGYISQGYVEEVISREAPKYRPAPVNVLAGRYMRGLDVGKNRWWGGPVHLILSVLSTAPYRIETDIDEEKAYKLFWRDRPGLVQSRTVRYLDPSGAPVYGSEVIVNRKKFRRWVLKNSMKFLMKAKTLDEQCTEREEEMQKDMEWDHYDHTYDDYNPDEPVEDKPVEDLGYGWTLEEAY